MKHLEHLTIPSFGETELSRVMSASPSAWARDNRLDIHARLRGAAVPMMGDQTRRSPTRAAAMGWAYWGSVSHGNRIQVSWLTSVMNVSTIGLPAGLA